MKNDSYIWIFNAINAGFPCAVFSTEEKAIEWIRANKVSGTLTEYPLDASTYEHAVESDLFKPRKEHESTVRFIETFSPITKHSHWEKGEQLPWQVAGFYLTKLSTGKPFRWRPMFSRNTGVGPIDT